MMWTGPIILMGGGPIGGDRHGPIGLICPIGMMIGMMKVELLGERYGSSLATTRRREGS